MKDLINGCVLGKRKSRKELFRRYHKMLLSICLRYSRDKSEAEDILLEGFMQIYSKIETYWNYETSMWDYSYMKTFEYEDGIRSFYDYNWDSIDWKPVSKNIGYRIDSYTVANDGYTYTGDSIWVHDAKTESRYDIYGNLIYYESYYFDVTNNSWIGNRKYNSVYTESGKILMHNGYIWRPEEGIWELVNKMEYGYNDNGLVYYECWYSWDKTENIWIKYRSNISFYSNPSSITDYGTNYSIIQIRHNPCVDQIIINYDTIANQNVVYSIYTISGKVVDEGLIPQSNTINVSKLDAGYYLLKLEVGVKRYSGKFLKL